MAYNPLLARRLLGDDPFFDADTGNLPAELRASQHYSPQGTHESSQQPSSQEMIPAFSGGYLPSVHDNPQHEPGLGLVSPQIAASYIPQQYTNQWDWGLTASPPADDDFPQTSTIQQRSNLVNPPTPGGQISSSQPKSVKHLTCWYWANNGCRLPDDVCLYSHFDTGRLADPPLQVQRGRPAVAGKNAKNLQPVYKDWRGHHRAHSAVGPHIQKQIEHIHAKAAHPSTPTPVRAEQSQTAKMIKREGSGSAEAAADFNRPHPGDHLSSPPAESYRNMSIDIGASGQPFHQQFSLFPRQTGSNFAPPSPAARYTSGTTQYGLGGPYGGLAGNHGSMSGNYAGMGDNQPNYGPGPHSFGGNTSGQSVGPSNGPTEMQIKDKVITELAGIVEMLEINYGISIDEQTEAVQKFMNVAHSLEEEARRAGNAASSTPSASTPAYGKPAANHERIMTAMEGSLNLVKMEKMVLAKAKARKQVVGGALESIQAVKLLPRGWIER